MDVSHPIQDLVPGARGVVLEALVSLKHPESARGIHRRCEGQIAWRSVQVHLAELEKIGLVDVELNRYVLNDKHVLLAPLAAIASTRKNLISMLRERISSWSWQPVSANLFGSVARNESDSASDIDVLLVVEEKIADLDPWSTQCGDLEIDTRQQYGNYVRFIEMEPRELVESSAFVNDIIGDAVLLAGCPLSELLIRAA